MKYFILPLFCLALTASNVQAQSQLEVESPTSGVLSLNSTGSDATIIDFFNANAAPTSGSDKRASIWTNVNNLNIGLSNNNTGGRIEFFGQGVRRMTMNADGRFGIGDIIPTQQLDVDGQVRIRNLPTGAAGDQFLTTDINGNIRKVVGAATLGSAGGDLNGSYPNPTVEGIHGREIDNGVLSDGDILRYDSQQTEWYYADYPSSPFGTSGTSIFNVPTSYNVGIGTSSPQSKLDVHSNGNSSIPNINIREDGTDFARIGFSNTSFLDRPWLIEAAGQSFDNSSRFSLSYTNSSGTIVTPFIVYGDAQVSIDRTSLPSTRSTVHIGSNTGANVTVGSSEYWEDGGNFGMMTNANVYPETNDQRDLGRSENRWDDVYATNGTINTSDRRDKSNIQSLNYGLSEIMQLIPVSFTWKGKPEQGTKLGLIAQDLQQVIGEVVKTHDYYENEQTGQLERVKNERLGVYYSDLIPVLIKAIQEQQKTIESLERKVDELSDPDWSNN